MKTGFKYYHYHKHMIISFIICISILMSLFFSGIDSMTVKASVYTQAEAGNSESVENTSYYQVDGHPIAKDFTSSAMTDDQLIKNAATAFAYLPPQLLSEFFANSQNSIRYSDMGHDRYFTSGHVSGYTMNSMSLINGEFSLTKSTVNICTDCPSADSVHMLCSTIHEFGHYLDAVTGHPSSSASWKAITRAEYGSTGLSSYYSTPSEYFAEQFAIYLLPDGAVYSVNKAKCPQSQAYIADLMAQYNAGIFTQ